jgi:hypothetical protein
MNDDDLMLTLHDIMERVEKEGNCCACTAQERIAEALELVAEERGAFLGEDD